ncbi:MAG: hypothetical protein K6E99_03145 [Bacilli bacterium]|nr:hypothetical protein [Bacilli bacterium]
MRKSIFDLEIRVDINKELDNLHNILTDSSAFFFKSNYYTLYGLLNREVFPLWKDKGLFVDFTDFLDKIGIDFDEECDEESFLYLIEALINLWPIAIEILDFDRHGDIFSTRVISYMDNYIPKLVEKMNYTIVTKNKKKIITKRDSDVDSIIDIVPDNCVDLLLEYNDIRNNNMKSKMEILKNLDKFIEEDKRTFKSINAETYNSIQTIVNKMGINHPLEEEPFKSFSKEELVSWYDKCFKLMIHLIRQKEINEINKVRKELVSE